MQAVCPVSLKEKRRFTCLKTLQKAHRQATLTTVVTGHLRQEISLEEAEVMHPHAQNPVMAPPENQSEQLRLSV